MNVRVPSFVFVYVIAVNVPLWAASRLLDFSLNGLFNIEYIVIGIASLFISQAVTVYLLLAATTIDLVYNACKTYMLRPGEIVASSSSAPLYVSSHAGSIVAIILAMVLVCFLADRAGSLAMEGRERIRTACVLAAIAFLGVAIDCNNRYVASVQFDYEGQGFRVIRNTLHRALTDEIRLRRGQKDSTDGLRAVGASEKLMELRLTGAEPRVGYRPNIVFVVVESWGKHRSNEVDDTLLAPYRNAELERFYTVTTGTVPFSGATVSGEMRELCGSTLGLGVLSAPASGLKGCLPDKVESMGYHTVAIHGFDGTMFERSSWYRKIHFEEPWFRSQLSQEGLPECPGPFLGICDAAIPGWIEGRLQRANEPQFVYWLTLNSHLPVPVANMVKDPPSCSSVAVLEDEGICAWYRLIFNVHRSVAELARKTEERPTIFVVVGDHAPPFSSQKRRDEFSYSVVPYVVLSPKCEGCQPSQHLRSVAIVQPAERKRIQGLAHENRPGAHAHGHGA